MNLQNSRTGKLNTFYSSLILSELVSILESKKIHGINPNPRCINACKLNINKVLEILRTKKVNYKFKIFNFTEYAL